MITFILGIFIEIEMATTNRHIYLSQYQFYNLSIKMSYEMQKVYGRGIHCAIKSKDKEPF